VRAATATLVRLPVWRARVVMCVLLAAFGVLAARTLYLQSMRTEFLQGKGEARYSRVLEIPGTRGRVLDRNGEALAISTPVQSVWAIPGDVEATGAQLQKLARLLGVEPRELRRKFADTSRDFAYLKRQIAPEQAEQVARLGLAGIYQHREYRRQRRDASELFRNAHRDRCSDRLRRERAQNVARQAESPTNCDRTARGGYPTD